MFFESWKGGLHQLEGIKQDMIKRGLQILHIRFIDGDMDRGERVVADNDIDLSMVVPYVSNEVLRLADPQWDRTRIAGLVVLLSICIFKGRIVRHDIISVLQKGFDRGRANIVQDVCHQGNLFTHRFHQNILWVISIGL